MSFALDGRKDADMVKTTGIEWKRFYSDKQFWPDGVWHDDEFITIDGENANPDTCLSEVPDEAKMTIDGGFVMFPDSDGEGPSLESYFKKWRKAQNTEFFVCEAPKDKSDAIRQAIKDAGGKIA